MKTKYERRPKIGKAVKLGLKAKQNWLKDLPQLDLSDAELDEDTIVRDLCKESFYDFVREFWDVAVKAKPVWNWHIKYLCREMQKVAENRFQDNPKLYDLLINIPPGTTKSTLVSVMFPAWVWTRMPVARFLCVSFRYPLALRLSRLCRDVITCEKYKRLFPEVEIRPDQNSKHHFANKDGGERYCAGSGGDIIGNHGDFILIDDPIDPGSVTSEAELESVNLWIEETLSGRKVDKLKTVTVLVMQRLHQDDPSARMLTQNDVRHICLPAVLSYGGKETNVKPKRLKTKYKEGLLDPIRLPLKVLHDLEKKPRGSYLVSGQYLEDPVPPGGGMFKTDKLQRLSYQDASYFLDQSKQKTRLRLVVRFWDKAVTEGGGAYTVGVKMGVTKSDHLVILDVKRFRYDSWKREREIARTARRDGRGVIVGVEQEPGSGGKESMQSTVRRLSLLGIRVVPVKPTTSKTGEARADAFSQMVNSGNVLLCPGPWNKDYIDELKHFPHGTYKDQVDASSGAFTVCWMNRRRVGGVQSSDSSPITSKTKTKVKSRDVSRIKPGLKYRLVAL